MEDRKLLGLAVATQMALFVHTFSEFKNSEDIRVEISDLTITLYSGWYEIITYERDKVIYYMYIWEGINDDILARTKDTLQDQGRYL